MRIKTERSDYLDVWKGVAIIAVIAIHASSSALSFAPSTGNWIFGLLFRQFINFPVPMFLALAGYFAGGRQLDTASDRASLWFTRLTRLALPYLFWSIVTIALRQPDHLISPGALMRDIFLGEGIGIGYFVIVLMQFVAVTPLISAVKKDWHHILVMAVITVVALTCRYYMQFEHPESALSQFPLYAIPLVAWYPFYHLGFWVRRRKPMLRGRRSVLIGLYAFFLLAALAESWLLGSRGLVDFAASQIKLSCFLMSGSLFLLVLASIDRPRQPMPLLAWFGRNSYFVYLTHTLVMAVFSLLLAKFLAFYAVQPIYVATLVAVTAAACGLAVVLIRRAVPESLAVRWLGVAQLSNREN